LNVSNVSDTSVYPELSLKEFLGIPQVVHELKWLSSTSGTVFNLNILDELFSIDIIWSRIRFWKYLACDVEVTFRINGTPFHYGQLVCATLPMRDGLQRKNGIDLFPFNPHCNPWSILQKQHIIIEPSKSNTVTLKIPYFAMKNFIDLEAYRDGTSPEGLRERSATGFDAITAQVLIPLSTVTLPVAPISITVFARMTNVILNGISVVTDDPFVKSAAQYDTSGFDVIERLWERYHNLPQDEFVGQVMTPAAKEGAAKAESHTLSGKIAAVGEKFASFVSSTAAISSVVASFFGKPNDVTIPISRMDRMEPYNNTSGVNAVTNLGANPDNSLARFKMCSHRKYTSFDNMCSQYGLMFRNETIDANTGNNFLTFPVSPLAISISRYNIGTPGGRESVALIHTPLSFVASAFSYWRGTLRYKIHICASDFHSGRLRITWNPNDHLTSTGANSRLSSMINRVIDIKGSAIHEFDVPFLSDWPYLPVFSIQEQSIPRVGNISLSMITPLTSSNSTIQPIHYNIYVCGIDMQFGAPDTRLISSRFIPFPVDTVTDVSVPFHGQVDDSKPEGLVPYKAKYVDGICFGEELTKVEDMIARPGMITHATTAAAGNAFFISPHYVTKGNKPPLLNNLSYMRYFRNAYRMWRGSYIVRRLEPDVNRAMVYMPVITSLKVAPLSLAESTSISGNASNFVPWNKGAYHYNTGSNTAGVVLPYYTNTLGIPNDQYECTYAAYAAAICAVTVDNMTHVTLVESAADDFQFMYWLGAPTLIVSADMFRLPFPYFTDDPV
jgi:hypothetical protein